MRRRNSTGLGIGQLFVLLFGFLIASALIFLFGIWVGRDITERRLAQEERVVRIPIPVQPTAKEEPKEAKDAKEGDVDLSFYQKLKEKAEQRLQETVAATSPTAGKLPQVTTPTRAAVREADWATATPARTAAKAAAAPTPAAKPKRTEPTTPGNEWADAGWTVQVNATTNPEQATDLAHRLRAKGYEAYTVQAPMRGQTWYRVRVGRFASRDKARELEARLKTEEGLENAYVTPQ